MGVGYVKGSLDSSDVITKAVSENEVVIHAATADDEPSVIAVLAGIKQRAESGKMTTYIHTSGTGTLQDHSKHFQDTGVIYSDDDPDHINTLPDSADHRNVDLKILKARQELKGKAKISIMLPPCIFGLGSGPFNKLSQQVIAHEKGALNAGVVPCIHDGPHTWSYVHNKDLIQGYITLLKHMLSIDATDADLDNPYYFCESFEQTWKKTSMTIAEILGLSTARATKGNGLIPEEAMDAMSSDSRSRAVRLRKLGWKPTVHQNDFKHECEKEIEVLKEQGVGTQSRAYVVGN